MQCVDWITPRFSAGKNSQDFFGPALAGDWSFTWGLKPSKKKVSHRTPRFSAGLILCLTLASASQLY
jgi:hypothetical protein